MKAFNPLKLITVLCLVPAMVQSQTFSGTAYEPDSDRVLYIEHHDLSLENGRPVREEVRYVTPEGETLALKTLRYQEAARPGYRLELHTEDRLETVRPGENGVRVESKKSGHLDWPDDPSVIDGGFHYYILEHFEALIDGRSIEFEFLAPTRLSWTALTIEPVQVTEDRLELTLRLQNPLIAWIIDPVHLVYERGDQRRLLEYRGLTNLPGPDGDNYRARIEYHYP